VPTLILEKLKGIVGLLKFFLTHTSTIVLVLAGQKWVMYFDSPPIVQIMCQNALT
jgi:hypothetical protein